MGTFKGTKAPETYTGTDGDDIASGLGGDDVLNGAGGSDRLDGGNGDDVLFGGDGNDVLIGDIGVDTMDGGAGDDYLDGGATYLPLRSADIVSYASALGGVVVDLNITTAQDTVSAGRDTLLDFEALIGSAFDDVLTGDLQDRFYNYNYNGFTRGGGGDDLIYLGSFTVDGGEGIDTLDTSPRDGRFDINLAAGRAEQDSPSAGPLGYSIFNFENARAGGGDDTITGNAGANTLDGGGGNDTIVGGGGADTLSGGSGEDTFVYRSGDLAAGEKEHIVDFSGVGGEHDRIDVTAFGITGLHEGRFVGDGMPQMRVVERANGSSTLIFDVDGDGARDGVVRVRSDASLTTDDFVFAGAPQSTAFTTTAAVEHASHQSFAELFHSIGHGVIA